MLFLKKNIKEAAQKLSNKLLKTGLNHQIFFFLSLGCTIHNIISKKVISPVKLKEITKSKNFFQIEPEYRTTIKDNSIINSLGCEIPVTISALGYTLVHDAQITRDCGIVLSGVTGYYQRGWPLQRANSVSLKGGGVISHYKNLAIVQSNDDNPDSKIEKGIFLGGYWPGNWYHWIIEIMSKSALINKLPDFYADFPLLVPEKLKDKNHVEFLKLILNNRKIVYLESPFLYRVETLIHVDSPFYSVPDFLNNTIEEKNNDCMVNNKLFKEYCSLVNSVIKNIVKKNPNNRFYPDKLFLARKLNKRTYNQNEIENNLKKKGFATIFLEDLPLEEQIRSMNNAKYIAGPTGAAWANLLFCQKGTKAIIWSPQCSKSTVYTNLACQNGVDLRYVYFNTPANNWKEFMGLEDGYIVSSDEIVSLYDSLTE